MNQIDNFRKVLGLPTSYESPTEPTPSIQEVVKEKKESKPQNQSNRKTITFDRRHFNQLKLLSVWCHQNGKTRHETYNALIEELVDCYCDVYPDAKEFLGRFL